jgi:flagellar assembly protein FliH
MKTPDYLPLMQRLPQARTGPSAASWMGVRTPAPEPMFQSAPAASTTSQPALDLAELERDRETAVAEGRAEGERKGWEAAKDDVAAAIARLGEAIEKVEASARAAAKPYASELVELALIVARELVGAEIGRDPAPLVQLIERCLDDVVGESAITIKLHPADRAALLAARPDLLRPDLRVMEDPTLARGGCLVESARRMVDARLEERLDNVREGLRELLEEARRAPDA